MAELGKLPGPIVGVVLMMIVLGTVIVGALAMAWLERRRRIRAFRSRRTETVAPRVLVSAVRSSWPSAIEDEATSLEALSSLVYDPLVWERPAT